MSFGCPPDLEQYRMQYEGQAGDIQNGLLVVIPKGLAIMFSNGGGWQHVSVSRRSKNPSYEDMCWAKGKFWSDDVCVMQLHVPVDDHVNCPSVLPASVVSFGSRYPTTTINFCRTITMKRYDCETDFQEGRMVEYDDGEYVKFEDVEAVLKKLEKLEAKINSPIIDLDEPMSPST